MALTFVRVKGTKGKVLASHINIDIVKKFFHFQHATVSLDLSVRYFNQDIKIVRCVLAPMNIITRMADIIDAWTSQLGDNTEADRFATVVFQPRKQTAAPIGNCAVLTCQHRDTATDVEKRIRAVFV